MKYLIACFWAAGVCGVAEAGPWALEPGGFYARALVAHEVLDGADAWRGDVYAERGLTDTLSIMAKAEAVRFDQADEFDQEAYRIAVRKQVFKKNGFAGAVELGVVHGAVATGFAACQSLGGEARVSLGYSGATKKGLDWYAFGDVAAIEHEGGCHRQRVELGYGADISAKLFVGQQVWLEHGNLSADSIKSESTFGYHAGWADVSVGYRAEHGGLFDEESYLIAITVRG